MSSYMQVNHLNPQVCPWSIAIFQHQRASKNGMQESVFCCFVDVCSSYVFQLLAEILMEASPEIIKSQVIIHLGTLLQVTSTNGMQISIATVKIDTPNSTKILDTVCFYCFCLGGTLTIQVGIASFDSSCLRLWGNCRDPGAKKTKNMDFTCQHM